MSIRLLDPTVGPPTDFKARAPRLATLDGATIGLVNNGKTWGREILTRIADNLADRYTGINTMLVTKETYSFPAIPADVDRLTNGATAIIAAIGD